MKARILRVAGITLLLATAQVCTAQNPQIGQGYPAGLPGFQVNHFEINVPQDSACSGSRNYQVVNSDEPWGQNYGGAETYFNLPAGLGEQSFEVYSTYTVPGTEQANAPAFVLIDGDSSDCSIDVTITYTSSVVPYVGGWRFTIKHRSGYAYKTGVHEFAIRLRQWDNSTFRDIRFKAVMLGENYTEVLGHYDAPSLPLFVLHDPPGNKSFTRMTTGSETCYAETRSANIGTGVNAWAKGKLGVAGEAGLFVTTSFEAYVEAGVSLTATEERITDFETKTCLTMNAEYSTSETGAPEDIFVGRAMRYAYGMARMVTRANCGSTISLSDPYFASVPVASLGNFVYTETALRTEVIPDLTQVIETLPYNSTARKQAVNQKQVWEQLLDRNETLKVTAPVVDSYTLFGGGGYYQEERTTATTESTQLEYNVVLEEGLSLEFAVEVGGSGVSGGGELTMRQSFGKGTNSSYEATNSIFYRLEDEDSSDKLTVLFKNDPAFGSTTFFLDSAGSRTSCPYEGGYPLDQPDLSVGTAGNTSMIQTELPVGQPVNFPLILRNNSNVPRTYYLVFDPVTNAIGGAELKAMGVVLLANDNGIPVTLEAGQSLPTNLTLTPPNPTAVDFPNINLYLYAGCGGSPADAAIRSIISISAYYGAGNFGSYCIPESANGTSTHYVDGVQIGNINNTGTGGGDTIYTNYSGQLSTPLSRNAHSMITITSGAYFQDGYAAWIDYNQNSVFEADEMIGAFMTTAAHQSHDIEFTVPASAALGTAILRVRSALIPPFSDPSSLDACFNYNSGETEDYAVVIDGNTPQDCLGTNNGSALPGSPCDDGNADTGNDTWNANCACVGIPLDCAGVPNGPTLPGTSCDDGDASTGGDSYDANCECVGLPYDCLGLLGGNAMPGTPCDDGNSLTGDDMYDANCQCVGVPIDCLGTAGGSSLPGAPCDDGNPLSIGDVFNANCQCVGVLPVDCIGEVGGTAQPGTPCNDNDPTTGSDVYGVDCICAGQLVDCWGVIGGPRMPGTPCNDWNNATENDVYQADCGCSGVMPVDCEGVPGGSAQPGTPCDDGDANTGNDVYDDYCDCSGEELDCAGVPGGSAVQGTPCDDGDPFTGNDIYGFGTCYCEGYPIDCDGVADGDHNPGTPCDDGLPETTNDMYTVNCLCAGTLATDCEGVAGGMAQPGEPCDDGDATTGNDTYALDCVCAGIPMDCEGTIAGTVLPGTACDDGDPCTKDDVWDNNCDCSGTLYAIGVVNSPGSVDAGESVMLFIDPVPGATGYSWDMPANWTSTNTNSFVLEALVTSTPGSNEVCVNVTAGGCTTPLNSCATVMVLGSTGVEGHATQAADWYSVNPNPSDGQFTLVTNGYSEAPMDIVVYDGTGREVMRTHIAGTKSSTILDLSSVDSGMYYLLATREGAQRVTPLVIAR